MVGQPQKAGDASESLVQASDGGKRGFPRSAAVSDGS
jgi:hypothetical protein